MYQSVWAIPAIPLLQPCSTNAGEDPATINVGRQIQRLSVEESE